MLDPRHKTHDTRCFCILLIWLCLITCIPFAPLMAQNHWLYVGTYTEFPDGKTTGSEGIYIYRFNSETGKLDSVGVEKVASPGYLTLAGGGHLQGNFLYAGINARTAGKSEIAAYAINDKTGSLSRIDQFPSGGDNAVYLTVSKDHIRVACANYFGANASWLFLYADGTLGKQYLHKKFTGSSVNPKRQEAPHPHCIEYTPAGSYILTDLGRDVLELYNWEGKLLQTIDTACHEIPPGSGPRHITFHPNGRYAYLVEELSGTVATFLFHNNNLILLQRLKTYNSGTADEAGTADVHVSPDGNFLYVSNRGSQNNLTIYSIDKRSGLLQTKGHQSTLGETPRNFTIDPTGQYVLVANQGTGNIVVFKRDAKTGMLSPTGETARVPQPTCLKMLAQ